MTKTKLCTPAMLASLTLAAACAPVSDEEETGPAPASQASELRQQAINNIDDETIVNCSAANQTKLLAAMDILQAALFTNDGAAFRQCFENTILATRPGLTGMFERDVGFMFGKMRENLPTRIECAPLSFAGQAALGIATEDLKIQTTFVQNAGVLQIAQVILHEVSHNKGFNHHDNAVVSPFEANNTVPKQLENCLALVQAPPAFIDPQPGMRSETLYEQSLAHLGGPGGSAGSGIGFHSICTSGQATGLDVTVRSGIVERVSLAGCSATNNHHTTVGTLNGVGCPTPGTFITAIEAVVDQSNTGVVTHVRGLCGAQPTAWIPATPPVATVKQVRTCPSGRVKAMFFREGDYLDRMNIHCQSNSTSITPPAPRALGSAGTLDPGRNIFHDRCPGRSMLTGLSGWEPPTSQGWGVVIRLAGFCNDITQTCGLSGCTYQQPKAPDGFIPGASPPRSIGHLLLPGHGDLHGGPAANKAPIHALCPLGQAAKGLKLRAGLALDAVQLRCVPVDAWLKGQFAAVTHVPSDWAGNPSGTETIQDCDSGEFVYGWNISARVMPGDNKDSVSWLQPICRRPY
jgi:hypothetical protein